MKKEHAVSIMAYTGVSAMSVMYASRGASVV